MSESPTTPTSDEPEETAPEADTEQATPEYEANPEATEAAVDETVVEEPDSSTTSTGEQIVENDISDDEFEELLEGTMKVIEEGKFTPPGKNRYQV